MGSPSSTPNQSGPPLLCPKLKESISKPISFLRLEQTECEETLKLTEANMSSQIFTPSMARCKCILYLLESGFSLEPMPASLLEPSDEFFNFFFFICWRFFIQTLVSPSVSHFRVQNVKFNARVFIYHPTFFLAPFLLKMNT